MPAPDGGDLELIEHAARKAGGIARRYFGGEYKRWSKHRGEPVTEADLAIDKFLRETLLGARPDYGWLSEESATEERKAGTRRFIVDPIDGTTAFLKGKPHFAISVAVVAEDRVVAGVVLNPITEECFTAAESQGAQLNGATIQVSGRAGIEGCRMLGAKDMFAHPGWSIAPNTPWPPMHIEQRNSIAYRMALVAVGAFDAMVVLSAKHDWDVAAGDLIVREAGGKVTTHEGEPLHYSQAKPILPSLLCAGPMLHARLLDKVAHVKLR